MNIQKGKLYENRTWLYLYPCLQYHGEELLNRFSQFFKLAVGVGDAHYKKGSNVILILFDLNLPFSEKGLKDYQTKFEILLRWLRYQSYYSDDYIYNEEKSQHMIVIKLPDALEGAYRHFVEGQYSKMYLPIQVEEFFKEEETSDNNIIKRNERYSKAKKVFRREKETLKEFVKQVNIRFNTLVGIDKFKNAELDYPPEKSEEIFNYNV